MGTKHAQGGIITHQPRRPASYATFPTYPVVYAIRASSGRIKIGYTTFLPQRFSELQSQSPVKLYLLATTRGAKPEEIWFHQQFSKYRKGGEWFALPKLERERLIRLMHEEEPIDREAIAVIAEEVERRAKVAEHWRLNAQARGRMPSNGAPKFSRVKVSQIPGWKPPGDVTSDRSRPRA